MNGRVAVAALLVVAGCATGRPPSPIISDVPVAPTPEPTPPPPTAPRTILPADDTEDPLIRVLLVSTSEPVELPQPGRVYRAIWNGGADWLWGPLEIELEGDVLWQVGAFGSADAARDVERDLVENLGPSVETSRSPGDDGLVRVRVRWRDAPPKDPAAALSEAGYSGSFCGGRRRTRGCPRSGWAVSKVIQRSF